MPAMRWTDYYAIGATVLTLAIFGYGTHLILLPPPQRGAGGGMLLVYVTAALLAAFAHGSVASGIAFARRPGPVGRITVGLHGLVLLGVVVAALRR